jgi:uncharacterized heparinase superfamily protein
VHGRTIELKAKSLSVLDDVQGGNFHAEARYHLHPEWRLEAGGDDSEGHLFRASDAVKWAVQSGLAASGPATFSPQFGLDLPSTVLGVTLSSGRAAIRFDW